MVIRKLRNLCALKGWLDTDDLLDEKTLYEAYYGARNGKNNHPLDPFHEELKNYSEEGMSFVVMHELLKDRVRCSLSTVRRYVRNRIKNAAFKTTVVRPREMGIMEVDFGRLGIVYDARERRNRVTYVFSGRLRYSGKAYREIVYDQKNETFQACHIHAFEYFGGVPERVVPDNLKAAVIKASFTDPEINRAYRQLAEHYGCLIDPCLPYKPNHKGGVESDIKYIKNNFYTTFKARQSLLGRNIPLTEDITPALREWEKKTADVRIIKCMGKSPDELFACESRVLQVLPEERFDPVLFKKCTVSGSGRVSFDRSHYSVPDHLARKEVLCEVNSRRIRVYFDHSLVAEHERSSRPYQDIVKPDHLSHRALAFMERTREELLRQAGRLGVDVKALIGHLLEDRVVSRQRFAWAVISLGKKYSARRLDAACRRALEYDTPRYDTVKRILEQNLDGLPGNDPVDSHGQRQFAFARKTGYFNISSTQKEDHP